MKKIIMGLAALISTAPAIAQQQPQLGSPVMTPPHIIVGISPIFPIGSSNPIFQLWHFPPSPENCMCATPGGGNTGAPLQGTPTGPVMVVIPVVTTH